MYVADPIAAVTDPDPYPYYRHLAATRPFHHDAGLGLWVAASADAAAEVLAHPDCRVRPVAQPVPPALAGTPAGALFGRLVRMTDGAPHAALKAVVMRAMAGIDLPDARTRARALAAHLPRAEADDAHEANRWMFTLPVLCVADLLGLPLERDEAGHVSTRVAGFVATFAAAMSPLARPADVEAGAVAAQWLTRWAGEHAAPGGLLAAMSQAAIDTAIDADIDPATLLANAIGLMIQACEATAGLVGNTLVRLGRLGEASGDLDELVADVARTDPPVQNTRRFPAADATLCGESLKAGDAVLVLLAAASHDPAGARPDRPWTFGTGRHGCPGDALARLLAATTVDSLLQRDVDPRRLLAGLRYRPSVNARIPLFTPSH
ncbi:Cytochrome P450 [Cupriavidus sp. OV038]|uniref:cytochrome P450 n=1 Tax=unclassified Cupriavidus TaxID=2640874 RepID=UPI0008F25A22|nr:MULTISPECIES: cytochrome P450 [unclassified Cupriavidus]SFC15084.1 Cytochrome P450 [Cupriavidus sp. OV038]SFP10411.1 Cytochrome P450 [Cupriavidus sp. OV096]